MIPNAKKNKIIKFGDGFKIYLTAPPVEGKANKAALEALAEYLGLKRSQLEIAKGERSRDKTVIIRPRTDK